MESDKVLQKSSEKTDIFLKKFNEARDTLLKKISESDGHTDKLSSHFDEISRDLQNVQKLLADSASQIPSYDLKKCQESLKAVESSFHDKMDSLVPRKKFAFKSSRQKETENKMVEASVSPASYNPIRRGTNECFFKGERKTKLEKGAEEIDNRDVTMDDLQDCEIYLRGNPSTLHATKLKGCKVFTGPISTSIFLEECTDCIFRVACQQLRIHRSKDCVFHLHITSRAVIEDCAGMVFSKYDWNYEGLDKHYDQSGLDLKVNNWDKVDDFNWLASDKASPNWIAK